MRRGPISQWQVTGNAPENYERYLVPSIFGPWATDLVSLAAPQAGERVLDAACGTGVAARLSATYVGPEGKVVGLDINPGMIATARSLTSVPGVPVEWIEGSAVAMPLPDAEFDLVLCQQGVQFFPDRPAALHEMHRVLVPGGRLALSVWRTIHYSPGFAVLKEALERHIGPEAANWMRTPFSLPEAEELQILVVGAGFRDVTIRSAVKNLQFPSSEEFVRRYVSGTPLAASFAQASENARDALLDEIRRGLREYGDDEGLTFPIEANLITARK
jgi:ubiquinone/menaquinone biosynthesis C-methylase UbiE